MSKPTPLRIKTLEWAAALGVASFIALAIGFALAVVAQPANAQMFCGDRAQLAHALKQRHDEVKVSAGLTAAGELVEIFVSPAGSWTMLITVPGGPTCVLGSGKQWGDFEAKKPDA